jgi:hypothetical protein
MAMSRPCPSWCSADFGCEYCPGGDLFEQIERQGKLQVPDARFYAAEIVQILEYLREKQVVHRSVEGGGGLQMHAA